MKNKNKTIEKLLKLAEDQERKNPIKPREFKRTEDGTILLNPNDPWERDWYENDKAYGDLV